MNEQEKKLKETKDRLDKRLSNRVEDNGKVVFRTASLDAIGLMEDDARAAYARVVEVRDKDFMDNGYHRRPPTHNPVENQEGEMYNMKAKFVYECGCMGITFLQPDQELAEGMHFSEDCKDHPGKQLVDVEYFD